MNNRRAKMRSRPARRRGNVEDDQDEANEPQAGAGWSVTFDLKGKLPQDVEGHTWYMVMVEIRSKWGRVHKMKGKYSAETLKLALIHI